MHTFLIYEGECGWGKKVGGKRVGQDWELIEKMGMAYGVKEKEESEGMGAEELGRLGSGSCL